MQFKIGDVVEWQSQSKGVVTVKRGIIVARVEPQVIPWDYRNKLYDGTKYIQMFDGFGRKEISYLVSVEFGPKAKPKLYWPRVKNLQLII